MCLLLIYHRVHPEWPIIIAANRHERLDRPATEPRVHTGNVSFVAPVDLVGGGTWLGINEYGVVAAITNGRSPAEIDPMRPSRGGLCWQALQARSLDEAVDLTQRATGSSAYNGFQLLLADRDRALVITNEGTVSSTELAPGLHVLTHRHGLDRWAPKRNVPADSIARASIDLLRESLAGVCRSHEASGEPPFAPCVHDPRHGTRSSALVLVGAGAAAPVHFAFTEGPPCQTAIYGEIPFALSAGSEGRERTSSPAGPRRL
jgi:hypothetical protein